MHMHCVELRWWEDGHTILIHECQDWVRSKTVKRLLDLEPKLRRLIPSGSDFNIFTSVVCTAIYLVLTFNHHI